MKEQTFEQLHMQNEKNALGLQYTIAERERLKLLFELIRQQLGPKNAAEMALLTDCLLKSPSERLQDIFALLASGMKKQGFFVEFGACDGIAANNTLMLEQHFGWTGILGEPSTHWHKRLRRNRKAKIDERCVSSRTGDKLKFFESEMPGNSSTEQDHAYLGKVVKSYDVPTVSLVDLLKQNDAPKFIDFISIDTEGHEMDVLGNFDFDAYRFGFLCVEQHAQVAPKNDLRPLLKSAGYTAVFQREEGRPLPLQITAFDLFFVPNDHPWASAYGSGWRQPHLVSDDDEEQQGSEATAAVSVQVPVAPDQRRFERDAKQIEELSKVLQEKDSTISDLLVQASSSDASVRKLVDRLDALWLEVRAAENKQRAAEATAREISGKLDQRFQELTVLTNLLRDAEGEARTVREDLLQVSAELTTAHERIQEQDRERSKLIDEQSRLCAEVKDLTSRLRLLEQENTKVSAEGVQLAHQIADLTEAIREKDQAISVLSENFDWLVKLHEHVRAQPAWWGVLAEGSRRRLELDHLERAGVFDGRAYLERYPDVGEAGLDPLTHYVRHGIVEGRTR